MKNVAGEIEGSKQAIQWAVENKKNQIKIFYDYIGIEKWANKEWKAKNQLTRGYVSFIENMSNTIVISFEHIKSHSGIKYNEMADQLAKNALYGNNYKTYKDGSIYFTGFTKDNWLNMIEKLNEGLSDVERIQVQESKPKEYFERLSLELNNEKLIINCYRGKKSYVQGNPSDLFLKIINTAIEKLPHEEEVVHVLNVYHALTVTEIEVENAFAQYLPNFNDDNDLKLRNTLLSAVFNMLISGYMPDYTSLIMPICRATEFYLHRILGDQLGKETCTARGTNNFSYFNRNSSTGKYEFNSTYGTLNKSQIDFLNELYNYYNSRRHPYAHWSKTSIETRVITDLNTAKGIILEGLKLINKYYKLF